MLQIILFSYFTENLVMSYQHFFWWQKKFSNPSTFIQKYTRNKHLEIPSKPIPLMLTAVNITMQHLVTMAAFFKQTRYTT